MASPALLLALAVLVGGHGLDANPSGRGGAPQRAAVDTGHKAAPSAPASPRVSGHHAPQGRVRLSGTATWYAWRPGQAAAGPALRRALGPRWRGRSVTVCAAACVRVRLTDWCACGGGRVVDLDARSFARLAPLSRGVLKVTVGW